jgi:hypothetical protein
MAAVKTAEVQVRFGKAVWREWGTLGLPFDVLLRDKWYHGTAIWAKEDVERQQLPYPIIHGQAWAELTNPDAWKTALVAIIARGVVERNKR